jgi:hypothetical protein
MKLTLQQHYDLIKKGQGTKDIFLKEAKSLFPQYVPSNASVDSAISSLKYKGIISESAPVKTEQTDWFKLFETKMAEAKAEEKNPTKEVVDMETRGFDYKDKDNVDNVYGQAFLTGLYAEMKDEKNEGKSLDDLKKIVAKNLKKDCNHYVKDGQFGVKGLGYTQYPSDKSLKENLDINDPVLMKMRAKSQPIKTKPQPSKNQSKINQLLKQRERLMFDMEQEAEPEGGSIADEYGDELAKIDKALAKLRGNNQDKTYQKLSYEEFNNFNPLKENKPKINEGYGMSLEDAKAEAQRIATEENVVQHVEETREGSGEYRVSDWYDSDLTVATYDHNGILSEDNNLTKESHTDNPDDIYYVVYGGAGFYEVWEGDVKVKGGFLSQEEAQKHADMENEKDGLGENMDKPLFRTPVQTVDSDVSSVMDQAYEEYISLYPMEDIDFVEWLKNTPEGQKYFTQAQTSLEETLMPYKVGDVLFDEEKNQTVKITRIEGDKIFAKKYNSNEDEYEVTLDKLTVDESKITESYNSEGPGLNVYPSTSEDLRELLHWLPTSDYHAEDLKDEDGSTYLFFPEEESTLDALETALQEEFDIADISVRFERNIYENEISEISSMYYPKRDVESNEDKNPYALYKNHPQFKEAEEAITSALRTATEWRDIQGTLDNYREVGADDTASREKIYAIFKSKIMLDEDEYDNKEKGISKPVSKSEFEDWLRLMKLAQTNPKAYKKEIEQNKIKAGIKEEYNYLELSDKTISYEDPQYGELDLIYDNNKSLIHAINIWNHKLSSDELKKLDIKLFDRIESFLKKSIKENLNENLQKRLKEIEQQSEVTAVESKLSQIDEEISKRQNKLNMVAENDDLAELVDKKATAKLKKEIKLLEKKKKQYTKIYEKITKKSKKELLDESDDQPTEEQLSQMKDELESYVDTVGNYEEAVDMYIEKHPEDEKHRTTLLGLAEPLF